MAAKAAAKPGELRWGATDIPKKKRQPMMNLARALYADHVECKNDEKKKSKKLRERMGDFAREFRNILDKSSMGTGWHVLMGEQLGFAAKKRNGTMVTFKVDKAMIVAWRSPGIEVLDDPPKEEAKSEEKAEGDATSEEPVKALAKFRVNEPQGELEEGSEVARTVDTIRSTLEGLPTADAEDVAKLAQAVRKRLTAELGTIWHVATGSEFAVEPAVGARNLVHVSTGKLHLVCFQHEQKEERTIDFHKILAASPYLLLMIFLFGFMTLHNVCPEDVNISDSPFKQMIRRRFCGDGWESRLNVLGGGAVILLMVSKKADVFFASKEKKHV